MSLRRTGSSSINLPRDLLKDLSIERLEVLANKEDEFVTFFSQLELDQMKDIQRRRDEITNANRELSLANTDRRPVFEQKKQELINGSLKASELKEEYDRKHEQLKALSVSKDRQAIYQELQQAVKDAEKESETLADQYLDGVIKMAPDEFIQQFLSDRSIYWSRRVKSEKMDVIMKQPLPYPVATPIPQPPKPAPFQPQPHSSMPAPAYNPRPTSGPLPPSYASLSPSYNNPVHSMASSYNQPPPPTSSMAAPVRPSSSMPMPGMAPYPGQQQGYPTASFRPSYPPHAPAGSYNPGSYGGGGIYQQGPYYPRPRRQ
ncbi:PREDICTED: vacuolar protein sorting-associated protein 37C-like [Amphimedon queenslandica]|uniref:VPS37 C-terminal domain-containing protein n=1 Tax=Amphimedon queenslandica TaxID=400682 RepID=A0A1X7VJA6_AMPQE|nr:PREDICTED: vacuolar protein sorting-associated protein 37C-like [Amphimedon queenslandica]|eukprot:XP_019848818.1 PREDICTED: vacuolar protein sorting-associated protein 37C-like [Amphimedon queenslandica]